MLSWVFVFLVENEVLARRSNQLCGPAKGVYLVDASVFEGPAAVSITEFRNRNASGSCPIQDNIRQTRTPLKAFRL